MSTYRDVVDRLSGVSPLHRTIVNAVPQLKRGRVWCHLCGYTQRVESGYALARGWPKHCGYTMSIDSPEERKQLRVGAERDGMTVDVQIDELKRVRRMVRRRIRISERASVTEAKGQKTSARMVDYHGGCIGLGLCLVADINARIKRLRGERDER